MPELPATSMELEERRLFSEIIAILRSHAIPADSIPTLAIVGVQSHGKSSLVEFFVGCPLTLIKEDTGTRCPTKFFLQFDATATTPRCAIVGVPVEVRHLYPTVSTNSPLIVNYKMLPDALGKVMNELEQLSQTSFSEDVLEVHITSDLCPNLFFVDLPGLVSEIDPRCETIASIVRSYLQMPNIIPIMCVKASEDLATGMLYTFIRNNALPGWKDTSLFVATHFDSNLPKNGDALTNKLEGHVCDPENPKSKRVLTKYFVSCNPPPMVDRATLMTKNHSELVDRIRSLDKLENIMIEGMLREVAASPMPNFDAGHWRKFLGLANAKAAIKRKWYDVYNANFGGVRKAIQAKQKETVDELERLRSLKDNFSTPRIRSSVASLSSQFLGMMKVVAEQRSSVWGGKCGFERIGMSYDEERHDFMEMGTKTPVSDGPYQEMSATEMLELPGPQFAWQADLNAKLTGNMAIHRLFRVNRAFLCKINLPEVGDDIWVSALGMCVKASLAPSWDHAVAQVVNWWLRQSLIPSVRFLTARVHRIFSYLANTVGEALKADCQLHHFVDCIVGAFESFMKTRIDLATSTLIHLVHVKSTMLDLSLGRSMALLFEDMQEAHVEGTAQYDAYNDRYETESEVAPDGNVTTLAKRLQIMISDDSCRVDWPQTRELTDESRKVLRTEAERAYVTQLAFSLQDIETLIICDILKPIHDPSYEQSDSGALPNSLPDFLNQVTCMNDEDLTRNVTFDEEKNRCDIDELERYQTKLTNDLVQIELKRDQLKKVYEAKETKSGPSTDSKVDPRSRRIITR